MNYQGIRDAVTKHEHMDIYAQRVFTLAGRVDTEVKKGPGASYRIMNDFLKVVAYDSPDFETYVCPPALLADFIKTVAADILVRTNAGTKDVECLLREVLDVSALEEHGTGKKNKTS